MVCNFLVMRLKMRNDDVKSGRRREKRVPEIKPAEATSVVVQRGSNTVKLKERKITGSKVCHSLNKMRLLVIMQSDCSGFDVVWAGNPYLVHLKCGRLTFPAKPSISRLQSDNQSEVRIYGLQGARGCMSRVWSRGVWGSSYLGCACYPGSSDVHKPATEPQPSTMSPHLGCFSIRHQLSHSFPLISS
jgi:hypothetical protein